MRKVTPMMPLLVERVEFSAPGANQPAAVHHGGKSFADGKSRRRLRHSAVRVAGLLTAVQWLMSP